MYIICKLDFEQYGQNCPSSGGIVWGELFGGNVRGELFGGNVRSPSADYVLMCVYDQDNSA